jgi:hypothetical protein
MVYVCIVDNDDKGDDSGLAEKIRQAEKCNESSLASRQNERGKGFNKMAKTQMLLTATGVASSSRWALLLEVHGCVTVVN